MKRKVNYTFLLLLSIFFLNSCNEKSKSVDLLTQAQNIVENNPEVALILLDSIQQPEKMDKDNYMFYIVTDVTHQRFVV